MAFVICLTAAALGFASTQMASPRGVARASPRMAHALIVQNKGGGHGEIGFHLAKALRAKGVDVTIVQDPSAKKAKLPFSKYESELSDCSISWCDPKNGAAVSAALAGKPPLTHVFENNAKTPADCAPALDAALASPEFKLFAFVSSAGMYTAKGELREGDPIKDPPTGQREVEMTLAEKLPGKWCAFRPQYIYGASRARASPPSLRPSPALRGRQNGTATRAVSWSIPT
jgi:nucleoside-diphosphate-sugar epimerase